MKKLLSILAGLAMTATTATTVVSCSWGCSSNKKSSEDVKVDDQGNVTATVKLKPTQQIESADDLKKAFGVYGPDGTPAKDVSIEIADGASFPLKAGEEHKFKITYNIKPHDGTEDKKYTVKELDPKTGNEIKDGATATIDVPKDGKLDADYGNVAGKVTMGKPNVTSAYEPDGHGYYKATTKDGKTVSVDENGNLVDVWSKTKDEGLGKRIAGLDSNGKPLTDKEDGGTGDTIYLDGEGYRIKNFTPDEAKAAGVTPGWHRVSKDGKNALGPDTGKTAWEINNGSETDVNGVPTNVPNDGNSNAKYVERNKDGKVIAYLNDKGQKIDANKEVDGKPNPNFGKPLKDGEPAEETVPPYTGKDANGKEIGNGKYADQAGETYQRSQSSKYTLNGNADIKLGSDIKKGSVIIGDGGQAGIKNGTSIALNPDDADSHNWQTIPNGKYAGMQVRISKDGTKVEFQWPVSDKQINDIASGSNKVTGKDDKNSPLDENGKINLPIEYNDGKNGDGKKIDGIDQNVNITTPWDADQAKGTNPDGTKIDSSMVWWIDPNFTKDAISYTDESTSLRIYLSSALADRMTNTSNNLLDPWNAAEDGFGDIHLSSDDLEVSLNGMPTTDDEAKNFSMKNIIKTDNDLSYVEFTIKAKPGLMFEENEDITLNLSGKTDKDGEFNFINDAQALAGTKSFINLQLSSIDDKITFKNTTEVTDDDNTVKFAVDTSKLPTAVDFDTDPKIFIKKKAADGQGADVSSLLKPQNDGHAIWDKATKTIELHFADGKLDKDQYSLTTEFNILNDRTEKPLGPVKNELIVNKQTASTEEQHVTIKENNVKFNGYSAVWDVTSTGEYVDKTKVSKVTVDYANDGVMATAEISYKDVKFDGTKLSFDLSSIPAKAGKYNVNVVFDLGDFGTSQLKDTLSVSTDNNMSIAQDTSKASFKNTLSYSFSLATKDSKFNAKAATASVKVQGDKFKDDDFIYVTKDGVETITLKKEIANQGTDKLKFLIEATDGINSINPQILEVAKDKMNDESSQVMWKQTDAVFENTNLTQATATFEISNKEQMVDINFSKLKDLKFDENNDPSINGKIKSQWDNTTGKLTLTVTDDGQNTDIKFGIYKFRAIFDYANGYETSNPNGTSSAPELSANKNVPLEKNTQVNVTQTAFSLDGGAEAVWQVNSVPDSIDLTQSKNIQVIMSDTTLATALEPTTFIPGEAKGTGLIKVKLDPTKEIPGGGQHVDVKINFATKEWMGYTGGTTVTGATGYVTKSEPTDRFFDIYWTEPDYQFSSDSSNAQNATFEVDKTKTGVDVSTDNLTKIEESTDGSTWTDITAKKGTTWTYENGKLAIKYTEDVMKTALLHTQPRQYRIHLGIGNGYENSKYADEHKDGFEAPILKVSKSKATSYEKSIKATANADAAKFNDNNFETWDVVYNGTEINIEDFEKSKLSIKGTKADKDTPWDPNTITSSDSSGNPNADAKRKAETLTSHAHVDISDIKNNGNDSWSAKIKISIDDGALWGDTYKAELVYKLKDYSDEETTLQLSFTKSAPNASERAVNVADGNKWDGIRRKQQSKWNITPTVGDANWLKASVKFKSFGGAIDPMAKPSIVINGSIIPDARWYFISRTWDDKSKLWTYLWETWGVSDKGTYDTSKAPSLTIKFNYAGFDGQTDPIKLSYGSGTEVYKD